MVVTGRAFSHKDYRHILLRRMAWPDYEWTHYHGPYEAMRPGQPRRSRVWVDLDQAGFVFMRVESFISE